MTTLPSDIQLFGDRLGRIWAGLPARERADLDEVLRAVAYEDEARIVVIRWLLRGMSR